MISSHIQKLLDIASQSETPEYLIPNPNEPRIQVGTLVSHAAKYYEKARYAVDYKEEHILRRTAIERILRRRLTLRYSIDEGAEVDVSDSLVGELIQAGYLPNDELPESLIDRVQNIVDKIVALMELVREHHPGARQTEYEATLISIATSEIEDFLYPTPIDEATVSAYFKHIKDHIQIIDAKMPESEQEIQSYLACRVGVLKNEEPVLFYRLWLMHYPLWTNMNDSLGGHKEALREIASEFIEVSELIEEQIAHPLHNRIVPRLKNDSIYFSFIRKVALEQRELVPEIFAAPEHLAAEVKRHANDTYNSEEERIHKSAWRAVIYILITKIILAFAIELPFDLIVHKVVNYTALGINVVFHPLLLIAMTRSISIPKESNTKHIVEGVTRVVYGKGHEPVRLREKRATGLLQYIAVTLYLTLFIASFSIILWGLDMLGFNIIGMALFILFLTFVSYFGLRIRFTARRWIVNTNEEKFLPFLWDLFTLPIVTLGRWLTAKFATVNIFVFILDFIIETPFKMVLQFLDRFSRFIKEKKEEFY